MLVQSLKAGLVTGLAMAVLVAVIFVLVDHLLVAWPVAFVPVFITGVYALHRAGLASLTLGRAVVAGALAGLVAGALSSTVVAAVSILVGADPGRGVAIWSLAPVLLDRPFLLPPTVVFYELGGELPFPWNPTRVTPEGQQLARIPLTLPLMPIAGAILSAVQAWLYLLLIRRLRLLDHAADRIARSRASFEAKLRVGFVILTGMIFIVGWLGWASTEEMHLSVHEGRMRHHWLEHVLAIQQDFAGQTEALNRLTSTLDPTLDQEVSALGQRVGRQLTHLRTIPPPGHPAASTGASRRSLVKEAERRLPAIQEPDSRFKDFSQASGRAIELVKSGNTVESRAALAELRPLGQAVETALQDLVREVSADLTDWSAQIDGGSHNQQLVMMLLILVATAVGFPLGYAFSQIVVRPITEVESGLERIGRGDFSTRVEVENRDELGALAERVNQMSGDLDGLYKQLHDLNENLQQKVEDQLEEIERARILRRYLSPQVADSIIAGGADVQLATTRKNLTVCFADIRGFTGLSERMEPEEFIEMLNQYFGAMTDIVFRYGGTLDKYYGDGMMVFFGDPVPYEDHAERAIRMALDMRSRLPELQRGWFLDRDEILNIGIGISSGYVTVGNIGSSVRLDYTVIGNNVNVASRLSDMAAPGQILATERTIARAKDTAPVREYGEITVEGSARPIRVYEVLEYGTPRN